MFTNNLLLQLNEKHFCSLFVSSFCVCVCVPQVMITFQTF